MPRATRAELEAKREAEKKPAKKKPVAAKKSMAAKKPVTGAKKKASVTAPKNASKVVAKSSGVKAVPGVKKKSAVKSKVGDKKKKSKEEKKKEAEEDAKFEEEQRKNEEHRKATNERLKREREEKEAAAKAAVDGKKKALSLNDKGRRVVPLELLQEAMSKFIEEGKTPLIVNPCGRADTFFQYQGIIQIVDGKEVFVKHGVHKTVSLEDTMENLRKKFIHALKHGGYLWICMANGATDFKNTYNGDDTWPIEKILSGWIPTTQGELEKENLLRKGDLDHNGFFMVKEGYQCVVSTQFEEEDYEEFLSDSIPMANLGPIIIEK